MTFAINDEIEKITCSQCILHSKVPGIVIDENGHCSSCLKTKADSAFNNKLSKYLTKAMEKLFEKVREENHIYDVLVSFSGGKDSSFLLYILKNKFKLRPLAFSVVHPLVNSQAAKNMDEAANKLNVDLIKFQPDEEIYKEFMNYGIMEGYRYGIGERVGCIICASMYKWASIRMAMKMNIPIVIDGVDKSQGINTFVGSEVTEENMEKGIKPFGIIHDIFKDAFGDKLKGNIINFDMKDLKGSKYPTLISPFTFIDYDLSEEFNKFMEMGFVKSKYKSLLTNCSAIHLLDYISLKRYDCVSYVREYAQLLKEDHASIMDAKMNADKPESKLNKKTLSKILDEYKNILYYIVDNKLNVENIKQENREMMYEKSPVCFEYYGKNTFDEFLNKILSIQHYADYFRIDLSKLGPIDFSFKESFLYT